MEIPRLNWAPRSDWVNVKSEGVVGDGVADDTAAIQRVYDRLNQGAAKVAYFPAGRYRITETLTLGGNIAGIAVIGHGRDTVLLWDGTKGGSMYWSNGVHRSRYEGLTYDGRGIAGIGSEHRSMMRYETHLIYSNCAFMNLDYGIAVSKNERKQASAEIWYRNCVFRNNKTGVLFNRWNDYDNLFDGCVFVDNGVGIHSNRGHFHVRNSHFVRSRDVDVRQGNPCHPASIRWSTSTDSHRFFETVNARRHTYPFTLQDNRIERWTANDGAVRFGWRGPNLIFDNVFVPLANAGPPIRLFNSAAKKPWCEQVLVHSNNSVEGGGMLIDPGKFSRVTEIPAQKPQRIMGEEEWFFRDTATCADAVYDAKRDFGAIGDGKADDTKAIQRAIDTAREHGKGAVAYLPSGTYRITQTLQVTGANYGIEGSGFASVVDWHGAAGGVMVAVSDPEKLTIRHLQMKGGEGVSRIRQTGTGKVAAEITYNNLHLPSVYAEEPGIQLMKLPPRTTVRIGMMAGHLHVVDSGQATVLANVHFGRLVTEGATLPKTGFNGLLFHNDATRDFALTVRDNQDLVIADFYNESNDRFLHCSGAPGPVEGRVTLGMSKISVHKPEGFIRLDDYRGRICMTTGSVQAQGTREKAVTLKASGDEPVDLVILATAFRYQDPIYEPAPSCRLIAIGNNLWRNENAKTYSDRIPGNGLKVAADALDDFRRIGALNRKINY